jgi:uncharacterized cofD-like protein
MTAGAAWSSEPSVVALGGGHGLAASLAALRRLSSDLTAVVTVADNGGSSGRLREEFGVLPPGDLRMALAALCGDDRWGQTWARVLQHRFESEGEMDGHSVGNLLIVALWQLLGDHVSGLDWVGSLLGARGRVLPMAITPIDIMATVRGARPEAPDEVTTVRGQVAVATTPGEVIEVSLEPSDPKACPEATRALGEADWVVLGPGSWYSSVIPHLLVPGLRAALAATPANVVVNLNLEPQPGETDGWTPQDHLAVLHRTAPDVRIHTVLADPGSVPDADALRAMTDDLGARLVLADVALQGAPGQHDPEKLARAYARVTAAN